MIRIAKESDVSCLIELWHSLFHDPTEYIHSFYDNLFEKIIVYLLEENREVIGMIHLLPCILYPNQKAYYWYAVGIKKEKQGQGYFKRFMQDVLKLNCRNGFVNLCVPAKGLENVYLKNGFSNRYLANDIKYYKKSTQAKQKILIQDASPEDFAEIEPTEIRPGSTVWNLSFIQYAFFENSSCDGKQIKFLYRKKWYRAFVIKKESNFILDYHNLTAELIFDVIDEIMEFLKVDQITVRFFGGDSTVGLCDSDVVRKNSELTMTLA